MIAALDFNLLLTSITGLYILLVYLIWARSRNLAFPLGLFFLYYWTISGAWDVVIDLSGGDSGKRYHYLLYKLFPVELNEDYFLTLVWYGVFLLVVAGTVYLMLPGNKPRARSAEASREFAPWILSHSRLIFLSLFCLVASVYIIRDQLLLALMMNRSGYEVTAEGSQLGGMFLLHQSFNVLAVIPLAIGLPVYFCGENGRVLMGKHTRLISFGYILAGVALLAHAMIMGNKSELFNGLISGLILFLMNAKNLRWGRIFSLGSLAFMGIAIIDFTRSFSLNEIGEGVSFDKMWKSVWNITSSNEGFSAHFSLYGVLHYDVPLTWGTSFPSLLASAVPRLIWPMRPETVYTHYAYGVGAITDQGYGMHYATGWYLNFGYLGIVLGAVVLGMIWVGLFRAAQVVELRKSIWLRVFPVLGFAFFTGGIPSLSRAGIEGYKAIFLYGFFIPMLIVWLAGWGLRSSKVSSSINSGN